MALFFSALPATKSESSLGSSMASGAGESTLNEWETIVTPMLGESIRRLSLNTDLEIQMMEKRLISFSDLQTIRAEKTDSEKKLVLLHKYLYTREPGSLRRFIDALKKAGPGNESLADTLDQEYRKRQNPSVLGKRVNHVRISVMMRGRCRFACRDS